MNRWRWKELGRLQPKSRPDAREFPPDGRKERDAWKAYASNAAAAFVMGWIAEGLTMPPSARTPDL
ncbi:MAG: hypothetical protein M0Q47_12910 [Methanothrix sp.]|uniref:hypothetical protein n=1 Tax=Methanothrix sp. TaxID=90426 RepID=UPI0025F6C1B0|nr:hypothetical protein [Methanothrix sp.]MCK9407292.1 hypothetical protein [Methanothrix sp.]